MTATFYLGTHMPNWLATAGVPLFVSHRRLARYKRTLPTVVAPWSLDSGGFTELSMFGGWQTSPSEYVDAVYRYRDEIGNLDWAAPQDWMCEPFMVAKTGKSIAEHQSLTVDNFATLRDMAPDLPFVPVLQGYALDDYLRCVDLYRQAGVDLTAEPVVGVGSVCRRHSTSEIAELIETLYGEGIGCHAFGMKTDGWRRCRGWLVSADSMAWSFAARHQPPMPGHSHRACANCLPYALDWRARHIGGNWQPTLWSAA